VSGIVRGVRGRSAIAAVLAAPWAVALGPGVAAAAGGALTSGDYTGPAGTQHYELYVPSTYRAGTPVAFAVALHAQRISERRRQRLLVVVQSASASAAAYRDSRARNRRSGSFTHAAAPDLVDREPLGLRKLDPDR
jgi:hypothetical protein